MEIQPEEVDSGGQQQERCREGRREGEDFVPQWKRWTANLGSFRSRISIWRRNGVERRGEERREGLNEVLEVKKFKDKYVFGFREEDVKQKKGAGGVYSWGSAFSHSSFRWK